MICVVLVLGACKKSSDAISVAAEFRDRTCKCTDAACVAKAFEDWAEHARKLAQSDLDADQQAKLIALDKEMAACRDRVTGGTQSPPATVDAAAPEPTPDAMVAAAPAPDAAPPARAFEPEAEAWGLAPGEVSGWQPRWNAEHRHLSFRKPGTMIPIHVRLLDKAPANAKALGAILDSVPLQIKSIKKVRKETKTASGWNAVVSGKSLHVSGDHTYYVEIHRHGDRALICVANISDLAVEEISNAVIPEDAKAVCASLAPTT